MEQIPVAKISAKERQRLINQAYIEDYNARVMRQGGTEDDLLMLNEYGLIIQVSKRPQNENDIKP